MLFIALVILVVSNVNFIYSDICADINYECESCLGNSFGCVWCADEVHNDTRCRLVGNPVVTPSWCQNIMNPTTEPAFIIQNEDFRPHSEDNEAVELQPQHVSIKARPRNVVEFTMSYKPDLDRPIDMYYIFDSSTAMKTYKEQFGIQASKIYKELKEISGNVRFRIGFLGMNNSESREYIDHDAVFKNNQEMQDIISQFDSIEISENENGLRIVLEGLMRALESKDISWLDDSRRIFVLFSDPRKVVHGSNVSNETSIENIIRGINKMAKTKHVNIVFTGLKDYQEEYKALATKIEGTSYVELQDITYDLENNVDLVNVIKEEYMKLVYTLELDVGVIPAHLNVSIKPPCDLLGRRCTRKIHETVPLSMTAEIHTLACPNNMKYKETFEVKPIGSQEKLTIDTHILCQCECSDIVDVKSLKCTSMGDYSCGICKCYPGRYGDFCQCIGDAFEDGWKNCRAGPKDFNLSGCDGNGDCICGVCRCHDGYTGEHCTTSKSTVSNLTIVS